jgi:hypothetical protein
LEGLNRDSLTAKGFMDPREYKDTKNFLQALNSWRLVL